MAKKKNDDDDDLEQKQLPGTEDEKDDKLISAARRYYKAILSRKAEGEEEQTAHGNLVRLMNERKLTAYRYRDVTVHLDVKEKCKVKIGGSGAEEQNGDE